MTKSSRIHLIKHLNVTDLAGEKVMIDFTSGKFFLLKGVANDIWDYLQSNISVADIEDKLLSQYDVDQETCHTSVIEFLKQMESYQFIEVVNDVP